MRIILVLFALFLFTNGAMAETIRKPVIVIDPGHGGIDPGTQSADGTVLEKDLNLQIAKKLAKKLRKEGFHVELTRETDEDATKFAPTDRGWGRHKRDLFGRVEAANQKHATMLISIHGNHGTTYNRGSVLYFNTRSFESYMLAAELQNRLNTVSNKYYLPRNGNSFFVIRRPDFPSVLVEYGYLSNPVELAKLQTDAYQEKLVQAMRDGIAHFITLYHVPK
ncbi:N-acetylmuramoyl-L-alanine amidase family protein [Effusibacillus consociatus]|uniref:N-acetylmuramoyl-L-alanine amidase n=1 Tax=Effusibacillus consociatus TaxID=1117041 RepID=A0ABV9Q6J6_9BACL